MHAEIVTARLLREIIENRKKEEGEDGGRREGEEAVQAVDTKS